MSFAVKTPEEKLGEILRYFESGNEELYLEQMKDLERLLDHLNDLIDSFLYLHRPNKPIKVSFSSHCLSYYSIGVEQRDYASEKSRKRRVAVDPSYHQEVKGYFEPVIKLLENKKAEICAEEAFNH